MKNIFIIIFSIILLFILLKMHKRYNNHYDSIIYKNSTIPIFIISYNQYTFVKSMVEQLLNYSSNIYIIDNKSTYPPLVNYLKSIEDKVNILYMDKNYGHTVYMRDEIIKLCGDKYIITDPDLLLNPNLPQNFIDILSELSDQYEINRIGFALDITNNINTNLILGNSYNNKNVIEWESQFWENRINNSNYELYNAAIDTTFVLINKKYNYQYTGIRVAGNFTCTHIPWLNNYDTILLDGELDYYRNNNISSTWIS